MTRSAQVHSKLIEFEEGSLALEADLLQPSLLCDQLALKDPRPRSQ